MWWLWVQVAVSLVQCNACRLGPWLAGGGGLTILQDRHTDLVLTKPARADKREGPSGGACVLLLSASMVEGKVAVAGYVDLRGRVHGVGEAKAQVQHAHREGGGVDRLLVPMENYEALAEEEWSSEEEGAYYGGGGEGVRTLVDVLSRTVQPG